MNKPVIEFLDPPKIPDCGLEKVKDAIDAAMGIVAFCMAFYPYTPAFCLGDYKLPRVSEVSTRMFNVPTKSQSFQCSHKKHNEILSLFRFLSTSFYKRDSLGNCKQDQPLSDKHGFLRSLSILFTICLAIQDAIALQMESISNNCYG